MYIIDDGNPIWVTNSDRPRQQHTTAILAVHIMLSAVYSTIGIAFDIWWRHKNLSISSLPLPLLRTLQMSGRRDYSQVS